MGVGPDNLKNGIVKNVTDESFEYVKAHNAIPDKAHNEYLQIAVTLGIPALIAYLIFLGMIIIPNLKYIFKQKYIFILLSIIGSYLVQAFFNISTIGIAPLFWLTLGIIDNRNIIENGGNNEV